MPRYEQDNSRRRPARDEEPQTRGRRSERGSGRGRKPEPSLVYHPIFTLFSSEKQGGRRQVDIKAYDGKNGTIEDVLSLEEFLFFMTKLYYGEPLTEDADDEYGVKLTGSLWEMDDPSKFADMSGNIRISDEQLNSLKDEYAASIGGNKKKAAKGVEYIKANTGSRKPKYEVPDEDEDDDEEYETVEVKQKKPRTVRPVAPVLDMETEVVGADEEAEDEENIPY